MRTTNDEYSAGYLLADRLISALMEADGRVRAEDLISAAASIVGERCIEAANDFDARSHKMPPGQRVLSEKVNELIAGNISTDNWDDYPETSVCGLLKYLLTNKGEYNLADFCSMSKVFKGFVEGIREKSDWGKVPLTIPDKHHPRIVPLRIEYETRGLVDQLFANLGDDNQRKLKASIWCLTAILIWVKNSIDKKIAIQLAMETLNGMAKTAPMTVEALKSAQN